MREGFFVFVFDFYLSFQVFRQNMAFYCIAANAYLTDNFHGVSYKRGKLRTYIQLSLREGSNEVTEIIGTVYSLQCSSVSPVSMTYKQDL